MMRRVGWSCVALLTVWGAGATPALSADDFSDFPDVPTMERMDTSFRDAGFYVGARGGALFADDTAFTITGPALVENAYESGIAGSAFFGIDLPDLYYGLGARAEFEVGLWKADIETHTVAGTLTAASDSFGDTTMLTGMGNVYVDYSLGPVRPFIGGGFGVARVSFNDHGVTGALGVMDDANNALAWQAMAGIGIDVSDALTLEAMVRYQEAWDVDLVSSTGPASSVDVSSTQVLVGARVMF